MTDFAAIAKEVSTVDEAVMKVLPFVSTMIAFVPGAAVAAPFMPLLNDFLKAIDNAAKDVAAGNPSSAAQEILLEIINHLTPNKPNSPTLTGSQAS